MFSLLNLILTVIILFRVYKYDKFYMITYDMRLKEDERHDRNKAKYKNKN